MKRMFLALAACALLPAGAAAEDAPNHSGFYIGANGGVSFLGNNTVKASNEPSAPPAFFHKIDEEYETGGALGAMVGYGFDFGLRLEGQAAYIRHEVQSMTIEQSTIVPTGRATGVAGTVSATAFMANAYYDFDTGTRWRPYLGAGVGMAVVRADGVTANFTGTVVNDSDTVLAFQTVAGVGYELDEGLVLGGELRMFGTTSPELGGLSGGGQPQQIKVHGTTPNISGLVTLRWYLPQR